MGKVKPIKKIARIVGVLYLAGMLFGIFGNILIQSIFNQPDYLSLIPSNSLKLTIGAIFLLMTSVWDASHGILMFPILKNYNERFAYGYLSFRIINATFLALQVLFILVQFSISKEYPVADYQFRNALQSFSRLYLNLNEYAYQIAMIFVGLASIFLCYILYKANLVPKFISLWGLFGYLTIFFGSVFEILGYNMHLYHTIPGGVWELFIGVWLIVEGFNLHQKLYRPLEVTI